MKINLNQLKQQSIFSVGNASTIYPIYAWHGWRARCPIVMWLTRLEGKSRRTWCLSCLSACLDQIQPWQRSLFPGRDSPKRTTPGSVSFIATSSRQRLRPTLSVLMRLLRQITRSRPLRNYVPYGWMRRGR